MKAIIVAASAAAFCALSAHASPPSVNPEPMDVDVDTLATIAKEKSKKSTIAEGMKAGRSTDSGCGSVNINSTQGSDKKSSSGIKEMFGKQSTTVVTGPVINMANCK